LIPVNVLNLSRRSTVIEVLNQVLQEKDFQEDKWVLIEIWRGVEKPLPPRTRILRVWHAWCSEQRHVTFRIQRALPNQVRFYNQPKKRRRPIRGPEIQVDPWNDTDSMSTDTSDSFEDESMNTSDTSTDEDSVYTSSKDEVVKQVKQQYKKLDSLTNVEKDLDERIKTLENHIQLFLLHVSIQEYKDKTIFLDEQLLTNKFEIANLESTVRKEQSLNGKFGIKNQEEEERERLETEIQKQIKINDRLETEALELSKERSLLETSVHAREELLSKCVLTNGNYSEPSSDSDFYRSNHLEMNLDDACSIGGKPIEHIPCDVPPIISAEVPTYSNETGSDADDEGTEDCSYSRLSSHDSFFTTNCNEKSKNCSNRDSQCYRCPDCERLKNRQSASSDSGNVSDDSKIASEALSSDSSTDSAMDSAISSVASQQKVFFCQTHATKTQTLPITQKPSLWKSESTDNDSDVFTSREVYAKQLRKNSKIFRSSSTKNFDSASGRSLEPKFTNRRNEPLILYKQELIQTDDSNEKIIETLV